MYKLISWYLLLFKVNFGVSIKQVVYNLGVSEHFVLKKYTSKLIKLIYFIVLLLWKSFRINYERYKFDHFLSGFFNDKIFKYPPNHIIMTHIKCISLSFITLLQLLQIFTTFHQFFYIQPTFANFFQFSWFKKMVLFLFLSSDMDRSHHLVGCHDTSINSFAYYFLLNTFWWLYLTCQVIGLTWIKVSGYSS